MSIRSITAVTQKRFKFNSREAYFNGRYCPEGLIKKHEAATEVEIGVAQILKKYEHRLMTLFSDKDGIPVIVTMYPPPLVPSKVYLDIHSKGVKEILEQFKLKATAHGNAFSYYFEFERVG